MANTQQVKGRSGKSVGHKTKAVGGPMVPKAIGGQKIPKAIGGQKVSKAIGGPQVPRAIGGPILGSVIQGPLSFEAIDGPPATNVAGGGVLMPRAVGGPLVPRVVVGGPLVPRVAGAGPVVPNGVGAPLKILCVHGVGDHHSELTWQTDWAQVISAAVAQFAPYRGVIVDFILYDSIFEKPAYRITPAVSASAMWKLSVSGVVHGVADLFRRNRGLADISSRVRWTAGMVVQWADNDRLREETRAELTNKINQFQPDLICAHSLGSLVTYDTLSQDASLCAGRRLMTFGSQVGNPFVRNTFGGRIVPLGVDFWYHLFNRNDDVFAAEISLPRENFVQIDTEFDLPGVGDHDALSYLGHARALDRAWREIVAPAEMLDSISRTFSARRAYHAPRRRALLVGINEYPNPEDRLEGCVNDVFAVSAAMQESGFDAEDIRIVLDDRATAAGILERLQWLLDDVSDDPAEERVFFYSGHGAQIAAYGEGDRTDHIDECLVPYDFDWSQEHAITDDQFFELYTQLPYNCRFVSIFDCCHSGGMTRAGGARVRGLAPPDDIRHRDLEWDAKTRMWIQRRLPDANKDLSKNKVDKQAYVGESGAKHRLGRAVPLRRLSNADYDKRRKDTGHSGPYMPVILQACRESELSYEYRHGVTSYGAFTYSMTRILEEHRQGAGKKISFAKLVTAVTQRLKAMKYEQTPCLVGPKSRINEPIPWRI